MNPSASQTALLIQCSRPFGPGVNIDRGLSAEAAKFGLAWHAVAAHAIPNGKLPTMKALGPVILKEADAYSIPHLALELEAHLFASLPKLFVWLNQIPRAKHEVIEVLVEKSFALHPASGRVREIENPTVEDHHYAIKEGEEIPGTLDLAIIVGTKDPRNHRRWLRISCVYMTDHKTGEGDFSRPDQLPQILTLAVMLLGFLKAQGIRRQPKVVGGVFHAFRRGIAKMYDDEIDPKALQAHREALALAHARIGDGTMRNGPMCQRCPARTGCPAGDSDLLVKAEALIRQSNLAGARLLGSQPGSKDSKSPQGPEEARVAKLALRGAPGAMSPDRKLGMLYEVIKNAEDLAKRGLAAIRAEVKNGALPELSNGKTLAIQERRVERMSKKAFISTYGRLKAERLFDTWRKDGALVKQAEEFMAPVDD